MKNDKMGLFDHVWVLRIVSLVLAILLFIYVTGSKSSDTRQSSQNGQNTALMANKTQTLKIPLEVESNSEKYVVTGFPQYVKIKITGPSALVTTTTNTQNFKVYVDLTRLGTGKHEVRLKASGLNKELSYTITPAKIKVNIQSRNTATVPVEVRLSSKTLNGSYQVGTPKAALEKVQITGAKSEVQQVAKVIAYVNVPKNAQSTLHRTVTLQAINESGQTMNVVIMPNTVSVTVPISQTDSGDKNSSSSAATSSAITQSNSDSSAESASASSAKHSSTSSASGSQSNNSSVSASENDTK